VTTKFSVRERSILTSHVVFTATLRGLSVAGTMVWACYQGYTYVRVGGGVGAGAAHADVPYVGQSCAVPANVQITVTNAEQAS